MFSLADKGPTPLSLEEVTRNPPICRAFRERKGAVGALVKFAVVNSASGSLTDWEWVAVVATRLLARLCLEPGKKLRSVVDPTFSDR